MHRLLATVILTALASPAPATDPPRGPSLEQLQRRIAAHQAGQPLRFDAAMLGDGHLLGGPFALLGVEFALADWSATLAAASAAQPRRLVVAGTAALFGRPFAAKTVFFRQQGGLQCVAYLTGETLSLSQVLADTPLDLTLHGPRIVLATCAAENDPELRTSGHYPAFDKGTNLYGKLRLDGRKDTELIRNLCRVGEANVWASLTKTAQGTRRLALRADVAHRGVELGPLSWERTALVIAAQPRNSSVAMEMDLLARLDGQQIPMQGSLRLDPTAVTGAFRMHHPTDPKFVWRNPLGARGLDVTTLAMQVGMTYVPPYLDNVGFVGDARIRDLQGKLTLLVDATNPDQCLIDADFRKVSVPILVSAMTADTVRIPADVRETLGQIALAPMRLSVIPAPATIAGIRYPRPGTSEGINAYGRMQLWGWHWQAAVAIDHADGIAFRAQAAPLKLGGVAHFTSARDSEKGPHMSFDVRPGKATKIQVDGRAELFGNSALLSVQSDDSGSYAHTELKMFDAGTAAVTLRSKSGLNGSFSVHAKMANDFQRWLENAARKKMTFLPAGFAGSQLFRVNAAELQTTLSAAIGDNRFSIAVRGVCLGQAFTTRLAVDFRWTDRLAHALADALRAQAQRAGSKMQQVARAIADAEARAAAARQAEQAAERATATIAAASAQAAAAAKSVDAARSAERAAKTTLDKANQAFERADQALKKAANALKKAAKSAIAAVTGKLKKNKAKRAKARKSAAKRRAAAQQAVSRKAAARAKAEQALKDARARVAAQRAAQQEARRRADAQREAAQRSAAAAKRLLGIR